MAGQIRPFEGLNSPIRLHSASSSESLFQHSKKGKAGEVGENCVRQTLGSMVTADANSGEILESAKP